MKLRCPTCRTLFTPEPEKPLSPFCSERCRLIDLGEWLNETHRIPADESPDDLSGIPPDDDQTH